MLREHPKESSASITNSSAFHFTKSNMLEITSPPSARRDRLGKAAHAPIVGEIENIKTRFYLTFKILKKANGANIQSNIESNICHIKYHHRLDQGSADLKRSRTSKVFKSYTRTTKYKNLERIRTDLSPDLAVHRSQNWIRLMSHK